MDDPAELINSPEAINQNWGGYSARVLRKRVNMEKLGYDERLLRREEPQKNRGRLLLPKAQGLERNDLQ